MAFVLFNTLLSSNLNHLTPPFTFPSLCPALPLLFVLQMPLSCNYNQPCTATQEGTSMYTITSAPAGTHKTQPCRAWKIPDQIKVGMHGCQGTVSHCVHPAVRRPVLPGGAQAHTLHRVFGNTAVAQRTVNSVFFFSGSECIRLSLLTLFQVPDNKDNASVLSHSMHQHH